MLQECRERFSHHRILVIPTCIMARDWRTRRDACQDRLLAVSFEVGGGENVPGIAGACATHKFTYLLRGPWLTPDGEILSDICEHIVWFVSSVFREVYIDGLVHECNNTNALALE